MALRITSASLPQPEASSQPPAPAVPVGIAKAQELVDSATRLLAKGDTRGFVALFGQAAAIEHDLHRYFARRLLTECGLNALRTANERSATQILLALAHGLVAALEANPAEPLLLNYTGVVFYELWELGGAKALFEAAQRLDPDIPHLERNLGSLKQRRRAHSVAKPSTHPALTDLSRRAKAAAARARPAKGLTLSLCMIVKDEEEMLPRSLGAIAEFVDEIIVVDTGSTDRTVEIAESFGALVIHHEWIGDFSAARNASLDAVSSDWFIYLDADEVLISEDGPKLRALTGQTWRDAFFLHERNLIGGEDQGQAVAHSTVRMFRNRSEYRFRDRLHEQIADKLPAYTPERYVQSQVRIDHYGYLGVVRDAKAKSQRNLEILLKQREEQPSNAFLHYNIGAEYFVMGQNQQALAEFERSWELLQGQTIRRETFVPTLCWRFAKLLRTLGRSDEAIDRCNEWLTIFPDFTDLVLEQAHCALSAGREEDAIEYFERCIEMGDAPEAYASQVGAGTYLPRVALALWNLSHDRVELALESMRWCAENYPGYFGTIHPYATALLRSGVDAAEAVAEIESKIGNLTSSVRFNLGAALYEAGASAEAERQFRRVVERQPESAPARAALVQALLHQRKYLEAAEEAAALPPESNLARDTLQSEIFALLLAGELGRAEDAVEGARGLGLPHPEQLFFRTWLGRLNGNHLSQPIPAAALPLIERIMSSLLRLQEFKAFELLVGILTDVQGQSDRERRERLALLYMRHGFLRSAAREWITVVQAEPDVPALLGLALVAQQEGQAQNALTFAEHALQLQPGNAQALQMVQTMRPDPQPVAS